jgi:hypothetical protein
VKRAQLIPTATKEAGGGDYCLEGNTLLSLSPSAKKNGGGHGRAQREALCAERSADGQRAPTIETDTAEHAAASSRAMARWE